MKKFNIDLILKASTNISKIIKKTPLELNERLSKKYNCDLYLKREDLQLCRSFKIRGALNKIMGLTDIEKKNGIVCASAGNHAQGVAFSSDYLNIKSNIFVPNNTPSQKINRIKYFSNTDLCNIHIMGNTFNECLNDAFEFTLNNNNTFIHPYNDIDVIAGQGTIAAEIYDSIIPNVIICGIGGGGLISGISLFIKNHMHINHECILYGIEPETCPSMRRSIEEGKIINVPPINNFVDGATVSQVGDITYNICKDGVDELYDVSIGKICETMIELYQDDGIITEPAGALSVAALDKLDKNKIKGKKVVCILSGGNNDISRYPEIMDICLRHQELKLYYIVQFVQKPGELRKFVNNILGNGDDIIRFEYIKKTNKEWGDVLIGIELDHKDNAKNIEYSLKINNFEYIKLNDNNILYSYLV